MFLEISKELQKNTCARVSFLMKLQTWVLQLYLKRDSGTGFFLWILRNLYAHLFYRTPPDDCFWSFSIALCWPCLYYNLSFDRNWELNSKTIKRSKVCVFDKEKYCYQQKFIRMSPVITFSKPEYGKSVFRTL